MNNTFKLQTQSDKQKQTDLSYNNQSEFENIVNQKQYQHQIQI